jgi:ArsR family metal-binding transcriptional regulator
MLIESFELEVEVSTHSDEHIEYEAVAHLSVDISPVLPYLNGVLSRGIYLPASPVLSWRTEGRNIGFWPDRIAVDHLSNRQEVDEVVGQLVDLVNRVWDKRDELEPDTSTHQLLQPLELYSLLPQTNCALCGAKTCYNFALQLVAGQAQIESCAPLFDGDVDYSRQRAELEGLLASKWPAL